MPHPHKDQLVPGGMAGDPRLAKSLACHPRSCTHDQAQHLGEGNDGSVQPGCAVRPALGTAASSGWQNKEQDQEKA